MCGDILHRISNLQENFDLTYFVPALNNSMFKTNATFEWSIGMLNSKETASMFYSNLIYNKNLKMKIVVVMRLEILNFGLYEFCYC